MKEKLATDSHGNLVGRYIYDPYGNLIGYTGVKADANTYRFSSKDFDPKAGLYYYGYRFYDPNLQRWINRDPLGEDGFEVLRHLHRRGLRWAGEPNRHLFVHNNPISRVDLVGLIDLLPETDADSCFQNCLTTKRCEPGLGKALADHTIMHIFGGFGTVSFGLAAGLEGFMNPVADVGLGAFMIFDVVDATLTLNELHDLRREARINYASCLARCARKFNDWDGAYEQWDMWKGPQ